MKKIIIAALVCAFSGTVSAYASENSLNVSCSDSVITISGKGDISENELISFVCVSNLEELESLGDGVVPHFIEAFNAENDEIYVTIELAENFEGGKYYIVAQGENYSADDYFIYIDKSKIEDSIERLNSAKTPDETGEILHDADIDIDEEIYEKNKGLINKILFTGIGEGYNTESFIKTLYEGYFAALVCSGESELAFLEYSVGEELAEKFSELKNQKDFELIFKESDFENDGVINSCKKAFIVTDAKESESWKDIRSAILKSDDTAPSTEMREYFDFSDYEKIENKNAVFQKMAENIKGIKSFEELKRLFENASETIYENENKPEKGGSSSGGSSSGGGMYSPVVADKNIVIDESVFSDVEGHWAEGDILALNKLGVISGYEDSTFKPDNSVTRAEFVKLICEAFDLSGEGEMSFFDVSEEDWYYKYINTAYTNEIINGRGEYFAPNENVTREDAAVIMYRILSKNYPLKTATLSFLDKSDISDYAKDAISAMKNEGIIEGVGKNRFEPKSPITRAQCAVLINKCMLRFVITE